VIVGFTGRARSGKDTASDVLMGCGYVKMSFANPIKAMLGSLLNYQGVDHQIIMEMLHGDLKEVPTPALGGRSARYALQTLGTEWGRKLLNQDIWASATLNSAQQYDDVVIADVRFPNEVKAIKEAGGVVYRVVRPGLIGIGTVHESEALIDTLEVDGEIINSAPTAEEFQMEVLALFSDSPAEVQ
jgi:hypothetical protein